MAEETRCPLCGGDRVDVFSRPLTGEPASRCFTCGYATVPRENAWGVSPELRPFLRWAPPGRKPAYWPKVPWQPEGGAYWLADGTESDIRPVIVGGRLLWRRTDEVAGAPRPGRSPGLPPDGPQVVYDSIGEATRLTRVEHMCLAAIQRHPPRLEPLSGEPGP